MATRLQGSTSFRSLLRNEVHQEFIFAGKDMISGPTLSIVVGVQFAQENLPDILESFDDTIDDRFEVLICYAENDPIDEGLLRRSYVKFIKGPPNSLIPELWRDGILAARGEYVATTTAHCIPRADWLCTAIELDFEAHVAFGGGIALHDDANPVSRAIHLLRYNSITPPLATRIVNEVAADNAVYRKADILACEDLLLIGFWEPSYHERFRSKNLTMAIEPNLQVVHCNLYSISEFMEQRRRHGRAFGIDRAGKVGLIMRIGLFLLSPLFFILFFAKTLRNVIVRSTKISRRIQALPLVLLFLSNWSFGEARGYLEAIFTRKRSQ